MGQFREYPFPGETTDYFQYCFVTTLVRGRTWEEKQGLMEEACAWCIDQFGAGASAANPNLPNNYAPWRPGRWWASLASIRFREEIDAVAFKMRWC